MLTSRAAHLARHKIVGKTTSKNSVQKFGFFLQNSIFNLFLHISVFERKNTEMFIVCLKGNFIGLFKVKIPHLGERNADVDKRLLPWHI